jgi:DNA-binding Lrp family transcriptional regulator
MAISTPIDEVRYNADKDFSTVVRNLHEVDGLPLKKIAELLEIKASTISARMRKLGYSFKRPTSFLFDTVQIEDICFKYLLGISSNELSKEYNCSPDTILRILRSKDVSVRSVEDYSKYNEKAFLDMESELAAYFYGWLLTDGYITKTSNETYRVGIELSCRDVVILERLREYIGNTSSIYIRNRKDTRTGNIYKTCAYTFTAPELIERLLHLGLKPNKSLKEVVPDSLKNSPHFWRGVFEGDGHILSGEGRYGITICGSKELCEDFSTYCQKVYPDYIPSVRVNGKGIYTVNLSSRKPTSHILENLYGGATSVLPRKYKVYMEVYSGTI